MDLTQIESYKYFFSDDGRAAIVAEIQKFKKTHGKHWLKEFKADFPDLVFIVDLIANHNATDAFLKLKEFIGGEIKAKGLSIFQELAARGLIFGVLETSKPQIFKFHSELKAEIDRKQF